MRKVFLHLTAAMLVLSACQKEVSLEDPNAVPGTGGGGGTPGSGKRLVRAGTRLGSDSVTIDYSYNAANYLAGVAISGTSQGQPFSIQQKINRDGANAITSVVVKSPLLPVLNFGRDSLVTKFVYDASSGRYVRSLTKFIYDNEDLTDSTVYGYSAVGKLNSALIYFSDGSSGYFPSIKTEYSYAENNLSEMKLYDFDGTSFTLEQINTFRHDAKVNPLSLPTEAAFLFFEKVYPLPLNFWLQVGLNDFFSLNNITNMQVSYVSSGDSEETVSAYTYNGNNLPVTCIRSIDGLPFATTTYFYQ